MIWDAITFIGQSMLVMLVGSAGVGLVIFLALLVTELLIDRRRK